MTDLIFEKMRAALRAEERSEHPTHKVGALIHGTDTLGLEFEITRPNFWPDSLKEKIGCHQKLGNASTTVHAEIAALYEAPHSEGAEIYITDLPCPNCSKMIAESGIKTVYIDSHTHNTPLGIKMRPYFEKLSTQIFAAANIGVYELNCEKKTIRHVVKASETKLIPIHRPIEKYEIDRNTLNRDTFLSLITQNEPKHPFAAAIAHTEMGQYFYLSAQEHRAIGIKKEQAQSIHEDDHKYEPTLQPLNRLISLCARYGLKIDDEYVFSANVPTSREFVNFIGAGLTQVTIGNPQNARDKDALRALSQIKEHNLLEIRDL